MRSSVILLGALLARNGKGSLGYPGGVRDQGKDLLICIFFVLRKLGAVVTEEQGSFDGRSTPHLQGQWFLFQKEVWELPTGHLGAVLAEGERLYWKIVPVSRKYSGFAGICVPWEQKYRGWNF